MSNVTKQSVFEELQAKRTELKTLMDGFDQKKMADGSLAPSIPANQLEEIEKRNAELDTLHDRYESLRKADAQIKALAEDATPANRGEGQVEAKTEKKDLVTRMMDSLGEFKNGAKGQIEAKDGVEVKTTMTTSAGYAPESIRSGVQVDTVQIMPNLMDFMQVIQVNQNAFKFMKETTFTNNAGVKGEGVAYDEAALAVTETSVDMNRLGVYIPVTEDQLEDEPAAREYLQRRLAAMVRIKAEAQILTGNGTAPQWDGILNLSGVQTVDNSSYDSRFDAIHQAIVNVMRSDATSYGGASANLVVLAPGDYHTLVTTRTADGDHIYGNPADPISRRIYGLPIVINNTITDGTGLVLDTNYFPIGMRRDIRVEFTNSHGELFLSGTLVFRVDLKGNVIALRDAAAVKVTNF